MPWQCNTQTFSAVKATTAPPREPVLAAPVWLTALVLADAGRGGAAPALQRHPRRRGDQSPKLSADAHFDDSRRTNTRFDALEAHLVPHQKQED